MTLHFEPIDLINWSNTSTSKRRVAAVYATRRNLFSGSLARTIDCALHLQGFNHGNSLHNFQATPRTGHERKCVGYLRAADNPLLNLGTGAFPRPKLRLCTQKGEATQTESWKIP
jgi:hypothetical protein